MTTVKIYPVKASGEHWIDTQLTKRLTIRFSDKPDIDVIKSMLDRGYTMLNRSIMSIDISIYDLRKEQIYLMERFGAVFV